MMMLYSKEEAEKKIQVCVKSRNHKCVYLSWVPRVGFEMELFIIFLLLPPAIMPGHQPQPHFLLLVPLLLFASSSPQQNAK